MNDRTHCAKAELDRRSAIGTGPRFVDLSDAQFQDADKARQWLEARRWPNGMLCPHCGNFDQAKIKTLHGNAYRSGLHACAKCRRQFTVTVGTALHRSKIPLNKWLLAMHLISNSEKPVSVRQLQHSLGITYQSAWHVSHRVRQAMIELKSGNLN